MATRILSSWMDGVLWRNHLTGCGSHERGMLEDGYCSAELDMIPQRDSQWKPEGYDTYF